MTDKNETPLKIVLAAMASSGHLNAALGVALLLHKRGHKVYFAHLPKNKSIIESQGIEFISILDYTVGDGVMEPPEEDNFMVDRFKTGLKLNSLESLKDPKDDMFSSDTFSKMIEKAKDENNAMMKIIASFKPDICLADYLISMPWMFKVDCPVVPIMSSGPISLYFGLPMGSGYSIYDSLARWAEFKTLKDAKDAKMKTEMDKLYKEFGVDIGDIHYAKQLGIYIYPGPLDYTELGPPKENWVRLESSIRLPEASDFEIPDKIRDKPGKLIYVSMGTIASNISDLINMILTPLAESPNRFIVSTGKKGDTIKLSDNMWGDKFVNQVALLPKVDLFITHGGSNSMIEGLAAGKPLIVIPQFGDQLDNAQRIADLNLGVKINLNEFTDEKLLKAIEDVLNDEKIHQNVARVSEELKNSDSRDKVLSMIEQLGRTKISPF